MRTMKKRLLFTVLLTAVILVSCKKNELPKSEEPNETAPVFYFKCNVNGVPMKIEAGVDNYYMFPSYYQDKNNLYVYKSELKQVNCSANCGFALSVLINDFQLSQPNVKMDVDNGVKASTYGFADGSLQGLFYTVHLAPRMGDAGDDYLWTFSDGVTVNTREATRSLPANKKYDVKLKYADAGGLCSSELSNVFDLRNPLQTNISMTFDNGLSKFSASTPAGGSYRYTWDFGDGSPVSHLASPDHTFPAQPPPYDYITVLTLIDGNNDTCISKYHVKAASDCHANYTAAFTPYLNPSLLSAVTIQFTDQNGVMYSSADQQQPGSSKFEIVSVEEYKPSDKGEPTKKIRINFNCSFNSSNGPVNITGGEAVIAVSYK